MMKNLTFTLLLGTALLSGCNTMQIKAGQDFDLKTVSQRIERNVTTRPQIQSWLGNPSSTGVSVESNGERYEEWTYYYAAGNVSGNAGNITKFLQIKFDQQGIVRAYNWSGQN